MVGRIEVADAKYNRVYVPDTNVLILNALAPHILGSDWNTVREDPHGRYLVDALTKRGEKFDTTPNTVIIPAIVEKELDGLKKQDRKNGIGTLAILAQRALEGIRKRGLSYEGNGINSGTLENGARILFYPHDEQAFGSQIPQAYLPGADDRIIYCIEDYLSPRRNDPTLLQVVSQDIGLRSRARDMFSRLYDGRADREMLMERCVEEFRFENIHNPYQLPSGMITIDISNAEWLALKRMPDLKKEAPSYLSGNVLRANQFI